MDEFDRAVSSIARRKAIRFFASRLTLIGLVVLLPMFLSSCGKRTACVDGKLYYHDASDVLVRDEWGRLCVEEKQQ